jgi:hypothetical protein
MSWQERIRARLRQETDGAQAERCLELLDAILAGSAADVIRQRLQVIEDAFDAQLRGLEERL